MSEGTGKSVKLNVSIISIAILLVIQLIVFAFGYGLLTKQVEFNRELITGYQTNQTAIMLKLDDLNSRMTRIETILERQN